MIVLCLVFIIVGGCGLIGIWVHNNHNRWKFFRKKKKNVSPLVR
jgi:hypothetical protein